MRTNDADNSRNSTRRGQTRRSESGFSLIELLIVVAILLIIAAIAIPNLLRAKIAANESSAVGGVRTITTASVIYQTTYGDGYPSALTALGAPGGGGNATCDAANLLDPLLTVAPYQKSGYSYLYSGSTPVTLAPGCSAPGFLDYLASASPIIVNSTGMRSFCSDEPGVIHFDTTGATPASEAACVALPSL